MRLSRGLTQIQVARALGYGSSQAIANIERGVSKLTDDRMEAFCALFGVEIYEVIEKVAKDHKKALESRLIKTH